jgi:hypothetical protein
MYGTLQYSTALSTVILQATCNYVTAVVYLVACSCFRCALEYRARDTPTVGAYKPPARRACSNSLNGTGGIACDDITGHDPVLCT